MTEKTCNKCSESKDESLFRKGRNTCKECVKIARREDAKEKRKLSNKTKKCSDCEKELSMSKFNKNSDSCKACTKQKSDELEKLRKKCSKDENVCNICSKTKKVSDFMKGRNVCTDCNNLRRRKKLAKERSSDRSFNKTCTKCNETMKAKSFKVGSAICRDCERDAKKKRLEKAKKELPKEKTCIKCDVEQPSDKFRLGENVCYDCSKEMLYEWRLENPDKFEAINRKYRSKDGYRESQNEYKKNKYNTDIQEKTRRRYRQKLRSYIFDEKAPSNKKFVKICNCSREKFRNWIEYNFTQGMTWDNYGTGWNLDHVKPCSSFDLTDEDKLKECFDWKNTVPVYPKENLIKFNKKDNNLVDLYAVKCKMFEDNITQRQIKRNRARAKKSQAKTKTATN